MPFFPEILVFSKEWGEAYHGPPPDAETVAAIREAVRTAHRRVPPCSDLRDLSFLVLDLETTGFEPDRDEIIALATVPVGGGVVLEDRARHYLVNPYRKVPPEVQRLTGITEEAVARAPDLFTVLRLVLPDLSDRVLVGHTLGFDLAFLNARLRRYCGVRLPQRCLDTRLLSQILHPEWDCHSLEAVLGRYGIPPVGRHTALGDVLLTARLLLILTQELQDRGIRNWKHLWRYVHHQVGTAQMVLF
jgi:DNA polymerase-3 subunit epsilon